MKAKINNNPKFFTVGGIFSLLFFSLALFTTPARVFALEANGSPCDGNSVCQSDYCDSTSGLCAENPTPPCDPSQNNSSGNPVCGPFVCGSTGKCTNAKPFNPPPAKAVAGAACTTDSDCQAGLQCSTSNPQVCVVAGTPPVLPSPSPDLPPLPSPSPLNLPADPAWCNYDPNLVYSNGLCLPKSGSTCTAGLCSSNSLSDLILKIIQLLLGFAAAIAVVFLVIGGFWYMTSAGNEEQAEKGRKALINAVIGLIIVILAYTIVAVIASTLNGVK